MKQPSIYSFSYSGFCISKSSIREYILSKNSRFRRVFSWGSHDNYGKYDNLTKCIICSIANNDYSVRINDPEIYSLLEEMIVQCGYDSHGVYSQDAHQAMRNLCIAQHKNPDNHLLFDKNLVGRANKIASGIKSVFGFRKKQEPEVNTPSAKFTPVQKTVEKPAEPKNTQQSVEPKKAHQSAKPKKKKWMYRITATVAGLAMVGAGMFMANKMNNADTNQVPNFKTVQTDSASYQSVQSYDIAKQDSLNKPATDSISVALTHSSKSALNILLGEKKADDLCRQVQSQMDARIFVAPRGMSAERIAHAITMSRIYEGSSVIVDALNSKTKLTPEQQAAFNRHIDEIGDMGVKLQKKMASKQKLSQNSRFNNASKSMRHAHAHNLKQLRQLNKKMANAR